VGVALALIVCCGSAPGSRASQKRAPATAITILDQNGRRFLNNLPSATSQIFDAHLMMMRDDAVWSRVRNMIQEGASAEYALRRVVEDYLSAFERIEDPYLQERALDVKDIGQRLLRILLGFDGSDPERSPDAGSVLIAREMTLTDLSLTAQINDSLKLGRAVLNELGGINNLHKPHVEQAGFAVLKAPNIPSILVETAFISNPSEETRLCRPDYQEQLAAAMLQGIRKYFARNQPLTRDKIAANP
jgi:N-acetylmuramoyl-L-alanine amidase